MPWPHIEGGDDPLKYPVQNVATPEGRELGRELARMADGEFARTGRDSRCETCAFRLGDHAANGSVASLMSAVKCIAEADAVLLPRDGSTVRRLGGCC
jgi:hypothetical protein